MVSIHIVCLCVGVEIAHFFPTKARYRFPVLGMKLTLFCKYTPSEVLMLIPLFVYVKVASGTMG